MNIVVCVKQVPDTAAQVVVENGQVTWGDAPLVINPWDEFAVEAALQLAKQHGGSVTVLTMGDESAKEAIKHALAMGCKQAVRIEGPADADTLVTAQVLAAAIRKIGEVDVVAFGRQAIDGDNGVTPAMVGRFLGWPVFSLSATIPEIADGSVTVQRATEEGRQVVEGKLPAVFSFGKDIGEPRYPSFMGIRKAARAKVPVWTLDDLGLSDLVPAVSWPEVMNPPKREITTEIIEGDSPTDIAEKLADKIMAEKVL